MKVAVKPSILAVVSTNKYEYELLNSDPVRTRRFFK